MHNEANKRRIAGLVTKPMPYKVHIVPRSQRAKNITLKTMSNSKTDILDFDSVDLLGHKAAI